MQKSSYSIDYDESLRVYFIRISGETTEKMIMDCFYSYEEKVEQHFTNDNFGILLNMDEEAHNNISGLWLIRHLLTNQKYRDYISAYAGVCDNRSLIENRNSNSAALNEGFFDNESDAIKYLSERI